MRLDSARSLKQEYADKAARGRVEALLGAPEGDAVSMALGVAEGAEDGDFHLAIRVPPGLEASAAALATRVHGEANVRVVEVSARRPSIPEPQAGSTGADWANKRRRPLEPGVAISLLGYGWVGTLFGFGRRANGAIVGLSNAHVLGGVDRVPRGTHVLQPFGGEAIGVTAEHVPLFPRGNRADFQAFDLRAVQVLPGYSLAEGNIARAAAITPADLGRAAAKFGRTTGVRRGRCTAVEVDNLPVSYGAAGALRFDDAIEFSSGLDGPDFSAGGDSGSMICWLGSPETPAVLFAGGRDSKGEDLTYGCRADVALGLLGLTLA